MFNSRTDNLAGSDDNEPVPLVHVAHPATIEARSILRELALDFGEKSLITHDTSLDLKERLDAYEDIIDSEVGDTHIVRARNIEHEVGLRQIYVKFEVGNPIQWSLRKLICFGKQRNHEHPV
jgi:hypothetical protein